MIFIKIFFTKRYRILKRQNKKYNILNKIKSYQAATLHTLENNSSIQVHKIMKNYHMSPSKLIYLPINYAHVHLKDNNPIKLDNGLQ